MDHMHVFLREMLRLSEIQTTLNPCVYDMACTGGWGGGSNRKGVMMNNKSKPG